MKVHLLSFNQARFRESKETINSAKFIEPSPAEVISPGLFSLYQSENGSAESRLAAMTYQAYCAGNVVPLSCLHIGRKGWGNIKFQRIKFTPSQIMPRTTMLKTRRQEKFQRLL